MNINWACRLKNKTTLTSLMACGVALVYQVCGIFGIAPKVAESEVTTIIGILINVLVMLGVVVDPTTKGINDSERAMGYSEPN